MELDSILNELLRVTKQAKHKLHNAMEQEKMRNPIPHRLSLLLDDFTQHIEKAIMIDEKLKKELKYHLSALYRDADMMQEMEIMLQRTSPINLVPEINTIKQLMSDLVTDVVNLFGAYESLYIVTPLFQQLSGLWGKPAQVTYDHVR